MTESFNLNTLYVLTTTEGNKFFKKLDNGLFQEVELETEQEPIDLSEYLKSTTENEPIGFTPITNIGSITSTNYNNAIINNQTIPTTLYIIED